MSERQMRRLWASILRLLICHEVGRTAVRGHSVRSDLAWDYRICIVAGEWLPPITLLVWRNQVVLCGVSKGMD